MPTNLQAKPATDSEPLGPAQQAAIIANSVMHALGQPGDFHRVQVRPLWQDHYRVNVFIGGDAGSVRIAHSYFLVADCAGNIRASTPKIRRQY